MASSSSLAVEVEEFSFHFTMGLRGYHFYRHHENWVPFVGEKIRFLREHHNSKDRFAVAGQVIRAGRVAHVTVGHVPRELSRYVWHAMSHGALFTARVIDAHYKPSPLLQGGLEIPLKVKLWWGDTLKLNTFKNMVEGNFSSEYKDESKNILAEILPSDADTDTFESDKSETSSVGSEESQNLPNTDTSSDEAELELPTMADNVLEETQSEEDDVVLVE